MKEKVAVSKRLSENIAQMEEFFHECDDIKKKELKNIIICMKIMT